MATDNDVIFGRGRGLHHHPGNQRLRGIVTDNLEAYIQADRRGRMLIFESIVVAVSANGGRFLGMGANRSYSEMSNREAVRKIRQHFVNLIHRRRREQSSFNDWSSSRVDELCTTLRATSRLKELTLRFNASTNFENLVAALAENKSMKKLSVDFNHCTDPLAESMVSSLCTTISKHPEMSSLTILASALGEQSSEAIIDMMRSSTLEELRVTSTCNAPRHCASKLLQTLEGNHYLKILAIPAFGGLAFPDFMKIVLNNSRMECVSLLHMEDTTADDLLTVAKMPRRKIPFVWEVGSKLTKRLKKSVCQVLKAHPEILVKSIATTGTIASSELALPPEVRFWADFRKSGRYLLERPDLPLSVWPRVFQLANTKPGVIYELLKGPAFLGRQSFIVHRPSPAKTVCQSRKRKSDEISA